MMSQIVLKTLGSHVIAATHIDVHTFFLHVCVALGAAWGYVSYWQEMTELTHQLETTGVNDIIADKDTDYLD